MKNKNSQEFFQIIKEQVEQYMQPNHMPQQPQMHDHEGKMAKGELRSMIENAIKLYNNIDKNQQLPGWVSAYITLASDYIHSVSEYMAENNAEHKLD